jgi:hypothetical protein
MESTDHPDNWYFSKTRREEAYLYEEEGFSSDLDQSEDFDPDTQFPIDSIIDDRLLTKYLRDSATGQLIETKIREFCVAWNCATYDITWLSEESLRNDGCGDLLDQYLEQDDDYIPPSKKELKRAAKEEKRYERKNRKKIRSEMTRERKGLELFEDFQFVWPLRKQPPPAEPIFGDYEEASESLGGSSEEQEEVRPRYVAQPLSIKLNWRSTRVRKPSIKARSPSS